jgi:hypothetical protein
MRAPYKSKSPPDEICSERLMARKMADLGCLVMQVGERCDDVIVSSKLLLEEPDLLWELVSPAARCNSMESRIEIGLAF